MEKYAYLNDEIQNINFNVRIFYAKRIDNFLELLEFEQIINDFIPFITKIILNKEKNEEVLTEFAKKLQLIIEYILEKNTNNINIIPSLEMLINCYFNKFLNNEDEILREESINSLIYLINKNNIFFNDYIYKLIINIENFKKLEFTKISICSILPNIFSIIKNDKNKLNEFVKVYEILLNDNANICRFAIQSYQKLIKLLDKDKSSLLMLELILNKCLQLIDYQNDMVKVNSLETLKKVMNFQVEQELDLSIENSTKLKDILMSKLENFLNQNINWRIKSAFIECYFSMFHLILNGSYNNDFINNFFPYLKAFLQNNNSEMEIKISILNNLYVLINNGYIEQFENIFLPILQNNTINDTNFFIRQNLAENLNKILKYENVKYENLFKNFYNMFIRLLNDNTYEVRYSMVKSIIINKNNLIFYMNLFESIIKSDEWRIRFEMLKRLDNIIQIFIENKNYSNEINELIKKYILIFFEDKANDIRIYNLNLIIILIKNNIIIDIEKDIIPLQLNCLKKYKNFTLKMYILRTIEKLYTYYNNEQLNNILINIQELKNDKVINIREQTEKLFNLINNLNN